MPNIPNGNHRLRGTAIARLLVVLALSGVLHWVVLGWANLRLAEPWSPSQQEDAEIVLARLYAVPEPTTVPVLEKIIIRKAKTLPDTPKIKTPAPSHQPAQEVVPELTAPLSEAINYLAADQAGAAERSEESSATGVEENVNQESDAAFPPSIEPDPTARALVLPPSADLEYAVRALRDGNPVFGHGSISWRSDGRHYALSGKTGILFFSLLDFRSNGDIDSLGLAPVLYSEKRFRRPETNTHFQHDAQRISFSSSTVSYPRQGGEQDRASIVWQLAGLAASNPEVLVAGARFSIFVAGTRNGEVWNMDVIGEEAIEHGAGTAMAWHLRRSPREKSHDQQLEIWLSPSQHWYPVRLRFTESNGEYLDMTLSKLAPVQASIKEDGAMATDVGTVEAGSDESADRY